MDALGGDRFDEQFYRNPIWVAENGGYLHSNNVLYYFATSPFFDPTSNNSSIVQQSVYNPIIAQEIFTRHGLEERLKSMSGIAYIVTHDPLESEARIEGPNGPEISNIWVINKQERLKRPGQKDEVTTLAIYYIVGDSIYMAPSVYKAVSNRTLSAATALNKILSVASDLSLLSPARQHTNLAEASQDSASSKPLQTSRQTTSQPENATSAERSRRPGQLPASFVGQDAQSSSTLLEAFRLSMAYRNEYMDEQPLIGEPGNFMVGKADAPPNTAKSPKPKPSAEERTTAAPTPLQTDVPPATSRRSAKDEDSTPLSASGKEKAKRRKSKPAITPAS
ncbi:MAG: hypothetical protein Q9160_002434 [Pyrenula sp. 1 TL-2023]